MARPLAPHLLNTMFDTTRYLERTLSTRSRVRLRVEELGGGRVYVHEAYRQRPGGNWTRWQQVEGEQSTEDLRLDQFKETGSPN